MSGTIGTSIKNLRIAQQVTQADLAKAVGISVQAVSKWECEVRRIYNYCPQ